MLHVATMGNAVLVGRGANVLTESLTVGLHVRLIAPRDRRLQTLMDRHSLNRDEAARRMKEDDEGRRYYVKKHFNRNVDDPVVYDLVLNTDRLGYSAVSDLIAQALEAKVRISSES